MSPHEKSLTLLFSGILFLASCGTAPDTPTPRDAIAVWSLEDNSPSVPAQPDLGQILSSKIMETIKKRGDYVVVERERLLRVLEELHLGTTGPVDEATRLKVGKIVGARWMIFGGYLVIGDQMRLDLRLVEVETGKIRKAVSRTAPAGGGMSGWLEAARKAGEEF